MRAATALVLILLPRLAAGQAELFKDIVPGTTSAASSSVHDIVRVGSTIYFGAFTLPAGHAVWKTDGTPGGTVPVKPFKSAPRALTPFGSRLLFIAYDDDGQWLWITAGTAATTVKLGPATDYNAIAIFNNLLLYQGRSNEPWVSDGTSAGTHRLIELQGGTPTDFLRILGSFGNFAGFAFGKALWVTDGTAAGTRRIRPDVSFDIFVTTATAGGRLYFQQSFEVWVTDGTDAGTHNLRAGDVSRGSNVAFLQPLGDNVLFYAFDAGGWGVWITDGTNVRLLVRVPAGVSAMAERRGIVYFARGNQLWRTDGTQAGTRLALDPPVPSKSLNFVAALGDDLWLTYGNNDGRWRSDGTPEGTIHLTNVTATPTAALNGRSFFAGYDLEHGGELWSTDGTPEGTSLFIDLQGEVAASSYPFPLGATPDRLFFGAAGQLWSTDGTAAGTQPFRDINGVSSWLLYRGAVYFVAKSSELWRSDGTPAGTTLVKSLPKIDSLFVAGDVLYIGLSDSLWTSDGTAAGTQLLSKRPLSPVRQEFLGQLLLDANNGTDGTRPPRQLFPWPLRPTDARLSWVGGGTIYIAGVDAANKTLRLFKSHGTSADTSEIATLTGVTFGSAIATTTQLFFVVDDGEHGQELWRTDGTAAGTHIVQDIRLGIGSSSPSTFAILNDKLLFTADDGAFGRELWITDGTVTGTRMLKDIAPLGASSMPSTPVVQNGIAWFAADDGVHGAELWRTDGTPEGTRLAADIDPGPPSSSPWPMATLGGKLFLAATTREVGDELWTIPAPEVAISIADVRVDESAQVARLAVTLSAPMSAPVTARWSADNGASGDVTIPAGQTRAEVAVPFAADGVETGNRVLYVRLRDVHGVNVAKSVAAVLIEDNELRADLGIALAFDNDDIYAVVTNYGPSTATDVRINSVYTLPNLAPGTSVRYFVSRFGTVDTSLTATASERDPNPSNDTATLQQEATGGVIIAVAPAWLNPGVPATLFVGGAHGVTVRLTSSNPEVLPLPASVKTLAQLQIMALSLGTTTITAEAIGYTATLRVDVVPPGRRGRWPAHMTFAPVGGGLFFGADRRLYATVTALTPEGERVTGTVAFSHAGRVAATAPVDENGIAQTQSSNFLPELGPYEIVATYSGDAHFFPDSASTFTTNVNGPPRAIRALMHFGSANAGELTIVVDGYNGFVPTGEVRVTQGTTTLIEKTSLDASGSVTATVALADPAAPVTVKYFGDSLYQPVTSTISIVPLRTHSSR